MSEILTLDDDVLKTTGAKDCRAIYKLHACFSANEIFEWGGGGNLSRHYS